MIKSDVSINTRKTTALDLAPGRARVAYHVVVVREVNTRQLVPGVFVSPSARACSFLHAFSLLTCP